MGDPVRAADVAERPASAPVCRHCGTDLKSSKFCPECGKPAAVEKRFCGECGVALETDVKFCGECGWKVKSCGMKPAALLLVFAACASAQLREIPEVLKSPGKLLPCQVVVPKAALKVDSPPAPPCAKPE
jgi:predicted amidophosphoribosyltransferase